MIRALILACMLALPGCSTFNNPPAAVNPTAATNPADAAQATINASLVGLIALGQTVNDDQAAGITTSAQAVADRAKLREYKAQLNKAQSLLDSGDVIGADTTAKAVQEAIKQVRKEIARRAAQ